MRKTQLETDQIAARQIQQTLQPVELEELPGYELEAYYKPLREVGGDYFNFIEPSSQPNAIHVSRCVWEGDFSGSACGKHTGSGQEHRKCGIDPAGQWPDKLTST